MDCECPGPGFCPRYQLEQQQYPWEVCQGKRGEAIQIRYQAKWARRAGQPKPPPVERPKPPPRPSSGVGTRLKELLAAAGVTLAGCSCRSHVARFDLETVEWCRERRGHILAWLGQVAERDGWPALDLPALVDTALTPEPRSTPGREP